VKGPADQIDWRAADARHKRTVALYRVKRPTDSKLPDGWFDDVLWSRCWTEAGEKP